MEDTCILSRLGGLDAGLRGDLKRVREAARAKLSRIVEVFPHYTSHDISHADTVLEICGWLAGPDLLDQLNAPELFVLCASVYLHDIGMALEATERAEVEASPEYQSFQATSGLSPVEALAEWVRGDHHKRSADIIRRTHAEESGVAIPDRALAGATALLCESHGQRNLEDFDTYDPWYAWGTSATTLCLPLLGVMLRLGDLLHVTDDRTPLTVLPYLGLQSARSKQEWARHLSTVGVAPLPSRSVRMSCICEAPDVHRSILRLCDYINEEFRYCARVLSLLQEAGRPADELVADSVEPLIEARGYEPWLDLTFQLDKEGILRLLKGERIYHGAGAVVRELLMNAVDATRQRVKIEGEAEPIIVDVDAETREISIADNGIGMDEADVREFLLSLGRCFYGSPEYSRRYEPEQRITPLSEFGIGFVSCFSVSDHVVLETRKAEADPILLDIYGLMDFVAARRGSRTEEGTTVRLCLKDDMAEDVINATKGLSATCRHVEIPILIREDGKESRVECQPYCRGPDELLVPYFRGREPDFVIEHRHFDPRTEDVAGCMNLMFVRRHNVMIPGSTDWYKTQGDQERRMSQLGFALPTPERHTSLLGALNLASLGYDLDLRGGMRVELDASRTRILPTPHNRQVLRRLDEHFTSFIVAIHNRYWAEARREARMDAYDALGKMLFSRITNEAPQPPFAYEPVFPLIDLFFENMPYDVVLVDGTRRRATWDEVRAMGAPVAFYYRFRMLADHEASLSYLAEALPGVVIIAHDASYPFGDILGQVCDQEAVYVSDRLRQTFPILRPWEGSAAQLRKICYQGTNGRLWHFLVPFMSGENYAVVSSTTIRRSTGVHAWVNVLHPKIRAFVGYIAGAQARGLRTPACNGFLLFLHGEHHGSGTDPEYVDYVTERQRPALNELVEAGVLDHERAEGLLLSSGDFVPWERDL